jgi:hypothetical protein
LGNVFDIMLHVLSVTGAGPARWHGRRRVSALASDDEDMIPVWSGRHKSGFTESEYKKLRNPRLLGKNTTIGEELELLREKFQETERVASERQSLQATENWNEYGEYVGSRWNTLSVLYGIMMGSIIVGLLLAYFGRGVWWNVDPPYTL